MLEEITTAYLTDLLLIFDPAVQQLEDDARVLYTFDDDHQPVRCRVGSSFIIFVTDAQLAFAVDAPLDEFIYRGIISPQNKLPELDSYYSLSQEDIGRLISDVNFALGLDTDEAILSLIQN